MLRHGLHDLPAKERARNFKRELSAYLRKTSHHLEPVEHGVLLRLILIVFNVLCSWWNWSQARLGRTRGRGGIAAGKQLWQPSWAAVWPKYSQHQVVPSHLPKCWLLCHFLQAVCNQLKQFLWLSSWHVISLQGRYYESYLIFGLIINPFLFNLEECFWPVLSLGWMLNHTKAQWLWHNVHPWATIMWFLGRPSKTT